MIFSLWSIYYGLQLSLLPQVARDNGLDLWQCAGSFAQGHHVWKVPNIEPGCAVIINTLWSFSASATQALE